MYKELNRIERARLILDIIVVFDLFFITVLAVMSLFALTKLKESHIVVIQNPHYPIIITNAKE